MVKAALRFGSVFAALTCAFNLHAKELADYKAGDIAADDIVATVPLDIIDPVATAARREAEAQKTPAIFLGLPDATVTNAMAREFSAAFATTRSNFMAAFAQTFASGTVTNDVEFSGFLADFNHGNKFIPVSDELARRWAAGAAAAEIHDRYLGYLLRMTHRPIRADALPAGFVTGDTFRIVFVNSPGDKPTLADADNGKIVTQMNSISRLQLLFRREFTNSDDQVLARALGVFFKPNCILDAELTKQARDRAAAQIVVAAHYDAGQVIVNRGGTIDAKAKAAISVLDEKLAPIRLAQQMAEQQKAQQEQLYQQQLAAQLEQQRVQAQAEKIRRDAAATIQSQKLAARTKNDWLLAAGAGIFASALAFVLFFFRRRAPKMELLPATTEIVVTSEPRQFRLQADLAPQVAQVVKETLAIELAAQRGELLKVQQNAAAELVELVQRLDGLQAPLNERLKVYESRIEELEKQLSSRMEENRELLRAKIALTRRQLETERTRAASDWSSAIN